MLHEPGRHRPCRVEFPEIKSGERQRPKGETRQKKTQEINLFLKRLDRGSSRHDKMVTVLLALGAITGNPSQTVAGRLGNPHQTRRNHFSTRQLPE